MYARKLWLVIVFSALVAGPAVSQVQVPFLESVEPEVIRGSYVTLKTSGLPEEVKAEDIMLVLDGDDKNGFVAAYNPDKDTFLFQVPMDLELGPHSVEVLRRTGETSVPLPRRKGLTLTVFKDSGKGKPKITGIHPVLGYPEKDLYGFVVVGEGFSRRTQDNHLILDGKEQPVCWEGEECWVEEPSCMEKDKVYGQVVSESQLSFRCIPGNDKGIRAIHMKVGPDSAPGAEITLARVGRYTPAVLALVVFLFLGGFIFWLASRGAKMYQIGEWKYGFLRTMLIDKETDTYSLSKLQLYLWTATAILAYLYFTFSRSLVQWKLDFAEIPPGLPGILLISGSTGFLAQGIQSAKGPKGAGDVRPSPSDLITTGGVVAPERFQFLVWTILGILVFLSIVFLQDPGNIKDLPTVPMGFLQLMGISSFGYLGGKLARKMGPVIDEIMADSATGNLVLTLRGRGLSRDASFRIDDKDVPATDIVGADEKPRIEQKDDQVDDPNMAKVLVLTLKPLADRQPQPAGGAKRTLTIINPDGQKAAAMY